MKTTNSSTLATMNSSTPATMNSSTVMAIDNLNESTLSDEDILHLENLQFMSFLIPTIVFLCFLSAMGVAGNSVVLFVYYRYFKPSVTRVYVLAMAACHLLTNVLVVVIEIMEICFQYTFHSGAACRLNGSVVSVLTLFSAFTLVAVARERHKKVCKLQQRPTSVRDVHVGLLVCGLLSVAVTVPHSVMRGPQSVSVSGRKLTGITCAIDDMYSESLFPVIYHVFTGVVFLLCVGIMALCYIRIAKRLRQHKKHSGMVTAKVTDSSDFGDRSATPDTDLQTTDKNSAEIINISDNKTIDISENELSSVKADDTSGCKDLVQQKDSGVQDSAHSLPISVSPRLNKKQPFRSDIVTYSVRETAASLKEETVMIITNNANQQAGLTSGSLTKSAAVSSSPDQTVLAQAEPSEAHSSKRNVVPSLKKLWRKKIPNSITWMMFILTAVFVINYLPYLVVVSMPPLRDREQGGWLLNVYHIALRSWFINSAVNPLVYSMCSARFRSECWRLMCSRKN